MDVAMPSVDKLSAYWAKDPANPELACQLCDALIETGQSARAEDVIAALPADTASLAGVQFRAARLDLLAGRYVEAEARLQPLAERHAAPALDHDIAFAQLCQQNLDGSAATLQKARARHGDNAEFAVLSARIALMRSDYAAADKALAAALAFTPQHPTALGLSALCALDSGDTTRAVEQAHRCLALFPDQHEALLTAGALALYAQDGAAAGIHFERALKRFPMSGRALSGLGQAQMLQGALAPAKVLLTQATQAMPDHIGTWHALGWLHLLDGERLAADACYRRAYALDRNFAESHGGLAVVALLDGQREEGEAHLRRALKLDPGSISGRYAQSLLLADNGEQAQSEAVFAALMREGALAGAHALGAQTPPEMARRLRARLSSNAAAAH
ncbi:tetratricopeptide repeat protein [Xanthomonas arboricola pv. juglandis]|nr:tetratricopeptide repeat protein [Xanthomonas arboricola]CAD7344119.1 tetratricopeptide repeat protein [Xanthomonas arboricola]CAD7375034.1 tetratricopeptide repeat protein [Xanthomonas arboricola]CAG2082804.1 tetratricopeptide repeat protein [Xanthomonas arboricola pv. juglandis]